jgi:hypothetical protein
MATAVVVVQEELLVTVVATAAVVFRVQVVAAGILETAVVTHF